MKIIRAITIAICMTGLLVGRAIGADAAAGQPEAKPAEPGSPTASVKASFQVTDRYTAQRRPRVTVLDFKNTNTGARNTRYGSSVEAMLVTFLKRKSQFVVVERQELDRLLPEKARLQHGMVKIAADNKEAQALLEKIDAFVFGSVTLLDVPTTQNLAQNTNKGEVESASDVDDDADGDGEVLEEEIDEESEDFDQDESERKRVEKREAIQGPRIELDVKLISRFDGRIIAAAQRSGPVACLRSIVERLGIALEQEFLRPYYGRLKVTLDEPEHIRVFLTPILLEEALDEEKPPVEYSTTVTIGRDYDIVEPWTTDPSTYTIKSLLSGWYSMRVERPGYNSIGIDNARWEVRRRLGREVVYERDTNLPLDKVTRADSRFVVRIDPLTEDEVDGNALGFTFTKQRGSIAPIVKRQYVDADYSRPPRRVILMGGKRIELNQLQRAAEYADDEKCDLFEERKPLLHNYGRTHVTSGGSFDFDSFTGGELIIEDYRGEDVPVGVYQMTLWEPIYETEKTKVRVRSGDQKKPVKTSLTRETAALSLSATGPRPSHQVLLEGRETRHQLRFTLDFEKPLDLHGLPADEYLTTTNITGLDDWRGNAVVPASNFTPPFFDRRSEKHKLELIETRLPAKEPMSHAAVKTLFGLAGRLETLSRRPDPQSADLFIDEDVATLLNLLLYGVPKRPDEEPSDFLRAAAEAGRALAPLALSVAAEKLNGSDSRLLTAALQMSTPKPGPVSLGAPPSGGGSSVPAEPPPAPGQPRFPEDPKLRRELLAERLEFIDLIVLDPVDMVQLQRYPEVAAILARYVAEGGSLFAYVSAVGNYRQAIGAPFDIEKLSKRTRRLDLAPGDVDGLIPKFERKEVKVKAKRRLPEIGDLFTPWRVLAYTRKGRRPRIVDREGGQSGGYVALWLDDPQSFRSRWGGTRSKVEETRAAVEDHVLKRARANMHRRFDRSLRTQQPCNAPTAALP